MRKDVYVKLNDIENKYKGYINNNKIVYNDGVLNTLIIKDFIEIKRENEEYKIYLKFINNKKTKGYYLLKEINKKLDLIVYTSKLEINENKIILKYIVNDENKEIVIRW